MSKPIIQPPQLRAGEFDLGSDHFARFTTWAPDLSIPANAKQYAHLAHLIRTQPVIGAIVRHRCRTETGWHEGSVTFRTELTEAVEYFRKHARWDVRSWEPLHLEPSLLSSCPCRDHGFIRAGRWVRA